jgi:hypothetical protein
MRFGQAKLLEFGAPRRFGFTNGRHGGLRGL